MVGEMTGVILLAFGTATVRFVLFYMVCGKSCITNTFSVLVLSFFYSFIELHCMLCFRFNSSFRKTWIILNIWATVAPKLKQLWLLPI